MNREVYCSSMCFITKDSFVKCGTFSGAFFCLFSLIFFIFSKHKRPFPSPSHVCLSRGSEGLR